MRKYIVILLSLIFLTFPVFAIDIDDYNFGSNSSYVPDTSVGSWLISDYPETKGLYFYKLVDGVDSVVVNPDNPVSFRTNIFERHWIGYDGNTQHSKNSWSSYPAGWTETLSVADLNRFYTNSSDFYNFVFDNFDFSIGGLGDFNPPVMTPVELTPEAVLAGIIPIVPIILVFLVLLWGFWKAWFLLLRVLGRA
jgi:hypothetical protein